MNSRSKKYYEARKAEKGDKKGAAAKAGYEEQHELTVKPLKKIPSPEKQVKPASKDIPATQDDTGGGNDSGKRSDDN